MGFEWVAPAITGGFLLAGTIATLIINYRINRNSTDGERAPDVTDAWREADRARASARRWEDLYYLVRGAFKSFARRMVETHGEESTALSQREREALEEPTPAPLDPQ